MLFIIFETVSEETDALVRYLLLVYLFTVKTVALKCNEDRQRNNEQLHIMQKL